MYGSYSDVNIANQARDHARALQDLFDGLYTPDEVLAKLRQGGLSKAKQATKLKPKRDDGWTRGHFQALGDVAARLEHFGEGQTLFFRGTIGLLKGRPTITLDGVRLDGSDAAPAGCGSRSQAAPR